MNIFADECVYKVTVDLLRSWGHDVLTAQDVELVGKPDEEILAYATMHKRVFITIDMDFSNIRHYSPKSHTGIIVAKIRPRTADAVHKVPEHLLSHIESERLSKSLVIVDQNKYRIRWA
jgi:predicted nuclease of predicted toxin-antitoxin system